MSSIIVSEINKIWALNHRGIKNKPLDEHFAIDKKLLQIFHLGNYYYFILNVRDGELDLISDEVTSVLGYEKSLCTANFLLNNIHPEDQPYFLNYEVKVGEFFAKLKYEQIPNYKISYDYRMRKKDGEYIRILQQVIVINFDEEGRLLRSFGIHTDISHIKAQGKPSLSFIGLNGEPSFYNIEVKPVYKLHPFHLTNREQQVLCLIVNGEKSEQIAKALHISKQTVDSHRKNILEKTEAKNTADLISKAILNGWI